MKPTATIRIATRELVDTLLAMNTNNRKLRKTVVDNYKRDLLSGNWHLTNQGIGVSCNGVLIDGQHRLEAIKAAGYPPVDILIVGGLNGIVQNLVDQQVKRSARDVLQFAFNVRVANQAPAICNVILRSVFCFGGGYKPTMTELMDCVNDYCEEIETVVAKPKSMTFFAAPYLAAFVLSCKNGHTEKTLEFMEAVEAGELLSKDMPAFHLRNLIVSNRRNSGGMAVQKERFLKAEKAVSAHTENQKMGVLRV